ncbi:hypothetical protein JD844_021447 [Phrynosoma platyrhinos]|uniref:Zinc transporter ZIP13 n=1 Tax=Phrynosoma platyrhinos TaxID=52577 RepID=A0ABQ7STR3_PHRPL|nr:hypothetical protein JD844_021447 [Phrynosoma platyrhinos]
MAGASRSSRLSLAASHISVVGKDEPPEEEEEEEEAGAEETLTPLLRAELDGELSWTFQGLTSQAKDAHDLPLCEKEAESWGAIFSEDRLDAWICSLIGSIMVGLSGVLPLLIIPLETGAALKSEEGSRRMKQLLSFAIGGLLGNVFLHLLPEAWAYTCSATAGGGQSYQQQKLLGLWVIVGLLTFLSLQKMFPDSEKQGGSSLVTDTQVPAKRIPNGSSFSVQEAANTIQRKKSIPAQCNGSSHVPSSSAPKIKISGYLNLLANTIDNFTHGLAVAASFLVSRKVGDFAILLRAGFDRWSAAKNSVQQVLLLCTGIIVMVLLSLTTE